MPEHDSRPFLGLVTALESETKALCGNGKATREGLFLRREHRTRNGRIVCLQCGPGPERSLAAARDLAQEGAGVLLCAGVASGLAPEARSGELVCTTQILLAHKGEPLPVPLDCDPLGPEAAKRFPASEGGRPRTLLSTTTPLLAPEEKQSWRERTGAYAVDMESAGVALAAGEAGLPFLAAQAICDTVSRPLSRRMLDVCEGASGASAFGLLRTMLRSPSLTGEFWRAGRDYARALDALKQAREELFELCFAAMPDPAASADATPEAQEPPVQ